MKHTPPILSDQHYFIDTHCHLDMDYYGDDLPNILSNAHQHGVKKIITIAIDLKSSQQAIELSMAYDFIFPTIGIHPHDVANIDNSTYQQLEILHNQHSEKIVGYGEIGLDYAKLYAPINTQIQHFERQLKFAEELELPIIIHCRDAQDDLLKILQRHSPFKYSGVIHCFSGDMEFAEAVLELGFFISIPGIVSFKNAKELHEVAKKVPLERMLIETDGPFLAPAPYRGKRNEPAYLPFTANSIAKLREVTIDKIAFHTTKNAEELFKI